MKTVKVVGAAASVIGEAMVHAGNACRIAWGSGADKLRVPTTLIVEKALNYAMANATASGLVFVNDVIATATPRFVVRTSSDGGAVIDVLVGKYVAELELEMPKQV